MPGRNFSSSSYRYGFQKQEQDPELWGGAVSFKYRVEDPRLGRFFSTDPLEKKYPHNSPYAFSENRIMDGVELEGLEFSQVFGTAWSYSGYDVNTSNQTGVAKQVTQDFKEVMKQPETYQGAIMGLGQISVFTLAGIFTEGVGSSLLVEELELGSLKQSENPYIFKGDLRSPSEIFETGFKSRGDVLDLKKHVTKNPSNTGYIPTSKKVEVAARYATTEGWVYEIENSPSLNAVDVNAKYGEHKYAVDHEMAVPLRIPTSNIKGAWKVNNYQNISGKYTENLDYMTGAEKTKNGTTPIYNDDKKKD